MEVIVRGRLSVYEPRGDYQVIVEYMEPVGLGSLQLAFDQLKEKLRKEGLFDEARKKPLPLLPQKVGIVTSPTGAAIRDMLRILKRRNASLDVLLYPVKVQGPGAAEEIAGGHPLFQQTERYRRHNHRARRRFHRRPLGLQRGSRGARDF